MKVRENILQEAKKKIDEALTQLNSFERKQLLSYYDTEASFEENLSINSQEELLNKREPLSSLDPEELKKIQIDEILAKIVDQESFQDANSNVADLINSVGKEGESIISFILKETSYKLKQELLNLHVTKKQAMSEEVRETIQSVLTYTEIPMGETKELIGHFFADNLDEFGIY